MKKDKVFMLNENQLIEVVNYAYKKFGVKPAKKINESELFDEFNFLNEAEDDEEANDPAEEKIDKVTDEQLRIDSLKIAVKLSRLMNKVTAEDLLEISTKVASYLKNHQVGQDYSPEEQETTPLENNEPTDEEESENVENVEDVEETGTEENKDENPEDIDVEEFTLDDEDEEKPEEANEGGSDIPEEFVL